MMGLEKISVLSLVLSTVAYFVSSRYFGRYLERSGIQKSTTRNIVVFVAAMAISYGVGYIVDWAGA